MKPMKKGKKNCIESQILSGIEKGKTKEPKLSWWQTASADEYYLACSYLSKAEWDAIK